MPSFVGGVGPLEPELMVIGEAPGKHENERGIPFVGPSGEIVDECFAKAGIKRSEVYITNVSKYQPPYNDLEKLYLVGIDINKEVESLWENEIKTLKPKCILAIGRTAMAAVMGWPLFMSKNDPYSILNYRGSILTAKDGVTKVVPTIHPAALFNRYEDGEQKGGLEYTYIKLIGADFVRAVEESKTRSLVLPERQLDICHNSLDLWRFFNEYKSLDKAVTDIESINCVPVCIGFAFNRHHAISIPLLRNIGKHKLTDMGNHELDEVWRLIDTQLRRLKLIGQNLKYDEFKCNLIGFEFPNVYSDTLIKTRVIFPELPDKRLHVQSSLWTREPYYKEEGKEFKLGKVPIEKLLRYNGRDCVVTYEIDEEQEIDLRDLAERYNVPLVDYYYNYMMRKHKFYLKMENVGFKVDSSRKKELSKKYTEMAAVVHDKVTELVGHEVNVNSYPQMFELLYREMKFKYMKRNPTAEDTIVRLLGSHAKTKEKKEILTNVLEERRIRTQKSRYINFCPDYDGRCKTSFNISATETCRSSTSILKKPVRPKKIGLAFHTISKHGRLAKDIRSMFVPDEGMVFLAADSSQAEARVVAVLSEDWELLEAFDKVDIHRRTAGLIFGYTKELILTTNHIPIVDILEKDGPERFCGKKAQPLDAKILTPNGWKSMGDIQVGDLVINGCGLSTKVIGVYPQGELDIFDVEFSDGGKTQSCKEHLWKFASGQTNMVRSGWNIDKLENIKSLTNKRGNPTKIIPVVPHVILQQADGLMPISPYLLGILLGDGGFTQRYGVTLTSADDEIVDYLDAELKCLKIGYNRRDKIQYYIDTPLKHIINRLGLGGKKSHEKFVPNQYKFTSVDNRKRILAGLLDTDGTVDYNGRRTEFNTTSKQLANDVVFIVRSLGGIASIYTKQTYYTYKSVKKAGKLSYRVYINLDFNPFNLDRKYNRWKPTNKYRSIRSIRLAGRKECQCIAIESEDNLYVTDDFIVTHNTRHAGNYKMGKGRFMVEFNTDAQKYDIPMSISEWRAGEMLELFHKASPKIQSKFHADIIDCLQSSRCIIDPFGGVRIFNGRMDEELFKEGFANIPQRTVGHLVQGAALKIDEELNGDKAFLWLSEDHDSLKILAPANNWEIYGKLMKKYMEIPIDFRPYCSLRRDYTLTIPCEIEISETNYAEFKKVKI